jgi:hypothetical protein
MKYFLIEYPDDNSSQALVLKNRCLKFLLI